MKLEPCPFCGGTAKYDKLPDRMDGITYGYDTVIVCTKCHASTGRVRGGKEKQQKEFAAKAWNTRQSTLSERVAELEKVLAVYADERNWSNFADERTTADVWAYSENGADLAKAVLKG